MNRRQWIALPLLSLLACRPGGSDSTEPTPAETQPLVSAEPAAATEPAPSPTSPTTSTGEVSAVRAALAHPDRLPGDTEIDQRRHPAEVLEFFGIAPGMTVLDMYSGSGYYSEILARTVGDTGKIWAHNNTPYLKWLQDPIEKRYANDRLAFVHRFTAENNQLDLPAETFDAVTMILTYHDIYHVAPQHGWPAIDGPKMMATIYGSMKPGAVLGVVDHAAAPGSPPETGESLHRIDPALARRELEAAGFVFEAELDILRNTTDDMTKAALDKTVAGQTNRFVYRFRKPAA